MRVARTEHGEQRDCLAQDWAGFMRAVLPECSWVPVPNLGSSVDRFVEQWGLDGLILSGGNDVGESVARDETEQRLLEWAVAGKLPVLGVCRGLQFLQSYFGGKLERIGDGSHAGTRHEVVPCGDGGFALTHREVNSYHNQAVRCADLAPALVMLARTMDGIVEACQHEREKIVGIMWHPEREPAPHAEDVAIFRRMFTEAP